MRIFFLIGLASLLLVSCTTSKKMARKAEAPARTEHELLDANTYKLVKAAQDSTYGYTEQNPIKVGGVVMGPRNEQRFLNALAGPAGEKISYRRLGTCCPFKTPNAVFGGEGMLDRYEVIVEDTDKKVILFLNMYDSEELLIPVGFTARK